MALALRSMQLADLAKIVQLGRACGIDWPLAHLESVVRRPQAFCRVAETRDTVVGALTAHLWPEEAEMLDLAVHPEFRRQRIGHSLLTELLTAAAIKKVSRILCEVAVDNHPALQLDAELGFVEVAIRPGYFSSPADSARPRAPRGVDARLMERALVRQAPLA